MRNKTTDVSGDFEPPEENKAPVRRRLTTKTSVTPVIRVVPVPAPVNPAPANPTAQVAYIGEEIDLANRSKGYWSKLDKHMLDTAIEQLGLPKEVTVNVKGEFVKKRVDKINKKDKLEMIYKKLNM